MVGKCLPDVVGLFVLRVIVVIPGYLGGGMDMGSGYSDGVCSALSQPIPLRTLTIEYVASVPSAVSIPS